MTVTIGRAGTEVNLDDPSEVRVSGDAISLAGDTYPGSVAAMRALVDQLCGLTGNPDETVIPFTWSEDSNLDGFVRPAAVAAEYVAVSPSTGYVRWGADLERVARQGVFEVRQVAQVITNSHSITAGSYTLGSYAVSCGLPCTAGDLVASSYGGIGATVTTASGTLARATVGGAGGGGDGLGATNWLQYVSAPSTHYAGACGVEATYDSGSTWRTVTGRDLPSGLAATSVRITNGLVRVSWTATRLQVAYYDGSQWDTAVDYKVGSSSSGSITAWSAVSRVAILRNSPEQVSVRLWVTVSTFGGTIDLTVQRGRPFVQATWSRQPTGLSAFHGVGFASTTACTDDTWGVKRTSADGDGNKPAIWTPQAVSRDTTNGELEGSTGATLADLPTFFITPAIDAFLAGAAYGRTDVLVGVGVSQRAVRL